MELVSPEEMPLSAAYASEQRLERQELGPIFTRTARVSLAFYLNLNKPHVRILRMDWGGVEQGKVLQDLLFSLPRVATQINLSAFQCPVSGSTSWICLTLTTPTTVILWNEVHGSLLRLHHKSLQSHPSVWATGSGCLRGSALA